MFSFIKKSLSSIYARVTSKLASLFEKSSIGQNTLKELEIILLAADTFRAAAQEQLTAWATETGSAIVHGKPQQDPASVVYTGCQEFIAQEQDILIIDTAQAAYKQRST